MIHALGFSSGLFDKLVLHCCIHVMHTIMYVRFVDENGNNYDTTKTINGPYGEATIFTGPKVIICLHTSRWVQYLCLQ